MKTLKIMLAGAVVVGFAALSHAEEAEVTTPAPEAEVQAAPEPHKAPEMEKCSECGRPKPPKHVEVCKECGRPKFDGMHKGPKGPRGPRGEFKKGERPQHPHGKVRPGMRKGHNMPPPPPAL